MSTPVKEAQAWLPAVAGPGARREGDGPVRSPSWRWARPLSMLAMAVALLPVVAVVVPLVSASLVHQREQAQRDAVLHSQLVSEHARQVLTLLVDAETGVRGYAATHDPAFLRPERRARRLLPRALQSFRAQVGAARPSEADEVETVISQAAVELDTLHEIRQLVGSAHEDRDVRLTRAAARGKATMDRIRSSVASVIDTEEAAGERRARAAERFRSLANTITYAASGLALLLGLALAAGMALAARRTTERRIRALDEALAGIELDRRTSETLLSSAAVGLVTIDAEGRCMTANPAAATLLGYEPEDLRGKVLHWLVHGRHADGRRFHLDDCPIRRTSIDGRTRRVDNDVFWRRDGTRLAVEYTCGPVHAAGVLSGVLITFQASNRVLDEDAEKLAVELRSAVSNGELLLHYQPKLELASEAPVGVEALVRWQHPERGLLFPDAFIEVAERSDVMNDLTAFVVEEAARQHARWLAAGHCLPVAVNLPTGALLSRSLPSRIERACQRHGVPTWALELEITETSAMADPDIALEVLGDLVDHGFSVSLDDFGTGFSSLSYLRDLPATAVKIDKSFVLALHERDADAQMVRGTITLVHGLGKRVVAEGVEAAQALDLLKGMGCEYGQGYLWSRPLPPDELLEWVAGRASERAGLTAQHRA